MDVAESQALNLILSTGSARGFKSSWFTKGREHFDYISEFIKKYGKVPDKLTFVDKFKDFKCFEVGDSVSSVIERLKESARYQNIVPIFNKAADLISEGKSNEACKILSEKIVQLDKELAQGLPPVDLTDPEIKKSLYKQHRSGTTKFPTGRPELDQEFGGWNNKDYVVIFARLGIGKSWIAEYFAYNLLKSGMRVGYYSGEMASVEVSVRLDTFNTHESNRKMYSGNFSEKEYEKIADSFSNLPGKFYSLTPEELGDSATVEDLRNFIENYKLQALFIDQISLMKRNSRLSKADGISEIADNLRTLQSLTGIPFFIVSQQHRQALQDKESKTKDDLMASISYSDALGQNATLAFYLDYDKDTRKLTLDLVKDRRGKVHKFFYDWDIDTGNLTYLPMADDEVEEQTEQTDTTDYGDSDSENPLGPF